VAITDAIRSSTVKCPFLLSHAHADCMQHLRSRSVLHRKSPANEFRQRRPGLSDTAAPFGESKAATFDRRNDSPKGAACQLNVNVDFDLDAGPPLSSFLSSMVELVDTKTVLSSTSSEHSSAEVLRILLKSVQPSYRLQLLYLLYFC
jgi:hypothetical protein